MTLNEFEAWALRHGYEKDRFGNFKKPFSRNGETGSYRYHIKKRVVCKEIKSQSDRWVRLHTGFFSQLSLNENDQLCGLKR